MFRPTLPVAILIGVTSASPLGAEPLQPVKPWVIDNDAAQCHAERVYSDGASLVTLAIRAAPTGESYELLVARERSGPQYALEKKGSVDFGKGPIKAWTLNYGTKAPPLNIVKFRIGAAEIAQAKFATTAAFHVNGSAADHPDTVFALRALPEVLSWLDKCNNLLRRHWNMTEPEKNLIATPARGDMRPLFSSSDYPAEAMDNNQEGDAQFLLLVDELGKVAGCHLTQPSGIPALDAMGCQIFRQRAKFEPAVDSKGKPVRSAVVTPRVRWRIY